MAHGRIVIGGQVISEGGNGSMEIRPDGVHYTHEDGTHEVHKIPHTVMSVNIGDAAGGRIVNGRASVQDAAALLRLLLGLD